MQISKTTYVLFVVVVTIMTLSVTVFKDGRGSATIQQNARSLMSPIYEDRDRFPIADSEDAEPSDPIRRAKLKRQKQRYDKDSPFSPPGPKDAEVDFLPEWQFDFPALPIAKSDVVLIGEVLSAEAHRSENKLNVFSNFDVRVDEVLKGNHLAAGNVITVQRVGGYIKYPNGRKVLFRLSGNGMPTVGARYALFLNVLDDDYSILTGYELGTEGVNPLDNSRQFEKYRRENEADFLQALRNAVSQILPQRG